LQDKAAAEEASLRNAKTRPELDAQLKELASLAGEVSSGLNEMHSGADPLSSAAKLDSLTHRLSMQEDRLK
jgi:hypothetical protein